MTDSLFVTPTLLSVEHNLNCSAVTPQKDEDLVRVAQEFESLFYNELFKVMRKTVPETSGQGFGQSMFNALLDEELAKSISSAGTLGISKALIAQFQGQNPQDSVLCVDKKNN